MQDVISRRRIERSPTLDDDLSVREARRELFRRAGLSEDGGYSARFINFRIGAISFVLPNTAARRAAVPIHDVHHVATGYDTSWAGEAEIAAWELASGCHSCRVAFTLNLLAFPIGLVVAPARTWRAFRRGRSSTNLYGSEWDDAWLDAPLGSLRARLSHDRKSSTGLLGDVTLFLGCAIPSLVGLAVLLAGISTF